MIFRSPTYRNWIVQQPCLKCGFGPCQAAHVALGERGAGIKAPDTHCVPLCAPCHALEHQLGAESFLTNADLKMEINRRVTRYLTERGIK